MTSNVLGEYVNGSTTGSATGATYTYDLYQWWTTPYFKNDGHHTFIAGGAKGYKLTRIYRDGGMANMPINVYGSNEPITADNYSSATLIGQIEATSNLNVTGEYSYVYLTATADAYFDSMKFYWEAAAGGAVTGDSFTVASYEEKKPSLDLESTSFQDRSINPDFTVSFESGAQYLVHGMFAKKSEGWWALDNANYEDPAYISVTAPAENMWIESVDIVSGSGWGSIGFGPDQELTPENYETAGQYEQNYTLDNSEGEYPNKKYMGTLRPQQPTKYLYYNTSGQQLYNVTVNWTAEKPTYTVATPTIDCWDDPKTNDSQINYNCATRLAKIKIEVYTKDSEDGTYVKNDAAGFTSEANYGDFTMPGLPGQYVKIVAIGVLEGCEDSAPCEKEFGPIAQADAPSPILTNNDRYVMPGGKVSVVVCKSEWGRPVEPIEPIEGAKVKYQYTIKDAEGTTVSTSETVTAETNPVEVTVPATAVPGQTFELVATTLMAYHNETSKTFSLPVISDVCPAPTFSLPSGSDMPAGTKIQIIKPEFADSLFYTLNGGEVKGENWGPIDVTIDQETVIEAWCTAKNLKPSEHVTATFKIEVIEAWMDVLVPQNFVDGTKSWQSYPVGEYTYASTSTDVSYLYYGAYMDDWTSYDYATGTYTKGNFDFINNLSWKEGLYYMTNTTAYDKKGENLIKSIKIDSEDSNGQAYIVFSNEKFDTPTVDSDFLQEDYAGTLARVSVAGPYSDMKGDYGYGAWIELKGLKNIDGDGAKYFMIIPSKGMECEIGRVVVHYWDPKDGVSSIVTEDVEGAVYSINGYRVNSENLAPGVYVRKQNGKTVKFVVK